MESVDREAIARLTRQAERAGQAPENSKSNGKPSAAASPASFPALLAALERRRLATMTPEQIAERERLQAEHERRQAEADERRRRERLAKLWERSGIPVPMRANGLGDLDERGHQQEARDTLAQCMDEFLHGGRDWWVALQGQRNERADNPGANGIGKTTLAVAAAVEACRAGIPVRFYPEPALVRLLRGAVRNYGDGGLDPVVEELQRVPLLVWDNAGTDSDFGRDGRVAQVTDFIRAELFDILDARMCAPLPVIITTNLLPDEFEERYGHDIYSRVYGMTNRRATWIAFSGPDLRKEWEE